MTQKPKYFIIEASLLPEVFLKTAEANRLLKNGEADTVGEAAQKVGLSRSAYYKYKDGVRPFFQAAGNRVITFYILLRDEAGLLSAILSSFAKSGANILTINQSIPMGGQAAVTISARMDSMELSLEALMHEVSTMNGVLKMEMIGSE